MKMKLFGYDKLVAMTSGAEAADAAVKIARKWGYMSKQKPEMKCHILNATACYHGITLSTVSMASKKNSGQTAFGPFVPNVGLTSPSGKVVAFSVIEDLREAQELDGEDIAAFMIEPIQGSAGIVAPPKRYLKEVATLCKQHNVLLIADKV
ncbi:aminotransferase class-III [Stipitochalara longipes BDJ]|nr:aminotransferase class-III [Stipitochalara longipes BDJ]